MTRHRLPFPATAASVLLVFCSFVCHCNSQLLPADEVDALNTIATKLKNTHWPKLTRTSCSDNDGFNGFNVTDYIKSNVTCNCSYQSHSVCHVTNIQLRGMNMTGVIPQEFGRLAYLEKLDLNRNYLNGTIPTNLTQIPLVILSLTGNRISGTIPKEIANMATLEELILEDNMLGGHLDPNLGKLSRLRRLLLSANNFTGEVPASFGNLKNLTDFLIDGSSLRGKIPEFIGNWTRLSRIDMQGSGIEGPIPSSISLLKTLTQLRISDLGGPSSPFPDLKNLTKLTYLVLRNCSLTGPIPPYIGDVLADTLYTLDLSFNKLTGPIPDSLQKLKKLNFLFLTDNMLSGEVPRWVLQNRHNMDLSYNDFTASSLSTCQQSNVNLVSSLSSSTGNSTDWCVKKDLPCPGKPQYSSLFINCGGQRHTVGDKEYLDDMSTEGPSNFVAFNEQWAYSSTGYYLDNDKVRGYTVNNPFALNVTDSVLYQTARLSPISLKYYGLCMIPGRYKVRLHFAEIQFTNDETFSSNGRRCFDVSIQGEEVLTNFNIMEAAGGAGIGIYKDFDDVLVNNTTLEIHLYWSGKGTTAIPSRGVHGPLISAITVTPNFKVGGGLSTGAIVGIVLSSVLIVLTLIAVWLKGVLCRREIKDPELLSADLLTGRFTLRQIKAATGNFSVENKIGEGGFGSVYKGLLSDGTVIAVKQLSSRSKQGNREFLNEIGMISALHHPNLVKLYGCCTEGKQLLLVYEYLENNCLARALYGCEEERLDLDWETRKKICIGIARGLTHLHEESPLKIVHRDIKATNVLLDRDLNAKISDFGIAKLDEEENTHISTRVAGTIGYMAPEYVMRGHLTDKADVYSFGIVALEIVSGKKNVNCHPEEFVYLIDLAYVLREQGNLLELVDPRLGSNYSKKEAMRMLSIALLCTNPSPILRPPMSSVVRMLKGKAAVKAPVVKRDTMDPDPRFRAFEVTSNIGQIHVATTPFSQERDGVLVETSTDGIWLDSSVSTVSTEKEEAGDLHSA